MINAPLRVAFDARSLSSPVLRGWDRYAVGLIGELVRQGVDVTLFHTARQPLHEAHVAGLGCRIVALRDLGTRRREFLHWPQLSVPLALWRGKFDLYHAPFERGVPLVAPCPVVLTLHSVTSYSYVDMVQRGQLQGPERAYLGQDVNHRSAYACYWRLQVASASHILTPSEFSREEIIRLLGIPGERVTTTHLAVHEQFQGPRRPDADRSAILSHLGVKKPYLLFVGGYEPHKNIGGLLKTFAMVRAVRPELSLVLVGTGEVPESARQHAIRLGLCPRHDVVFLSNVTEELLDLYDGAQLLVTLSWRETFCLPVLEAMTRGTPIVASAWGATPEVVGEAGRLVDPRDHAAARDAILALLAERDNQALPTEKIRAHARRFTWTKTAGQTLEVYKRLLKA